MPIVDLPTWNDFLSELISVLIRIGLAAAALVIGRWLARAAQRGVVRALNRTDLTPSMNTIFVAIAYYGMWLLAVMAALLLLGVPNGVVLTSVGVVFVVLGISLQQSLRDLAAAVIFMLFKPFKLGDLIQTKAMTGIVEDIGPFSTTLVRWDGLVVILPNSQIQESGIINYATKPTLMTDLAIRVGYGEDLQRVRRLISDVLAGDARVMAEPPPRIPVLAEDDSWVRLSVRAGVHLGDYWDLQDTLREQIRIRLLGAGIAVPYPHADVDLTTTGKPSWNPADAA